MGDLHPTDEAPATGIELPLSPRRRRPRSSGTARWSAEVTEPAGSPQLFSADTVAVLLQVADLSLTEQWQGLLLDTLHDLEPAVHRLRAFDLGETPPATAFDARWS